MKEVYSSLFKGNVHLTTKFSSKHPANDFGNYKTRNHIYSAAKLGNGTVQIVRTYYKSPANGKTYKNSLVVWIKYDNGMRCGMYHGYVKDRIVKVDFFPLGIDYEKYADSGTKKIPDENA